MMVPVVRTHRTSAANLGFPTKLSPTVEALVPVGPYVHRRMSLAENQSDTSVSSEM